MRRLPALLLSLLMPLAPARALDFKIVNPNQQDFHDVAKDITAALDYKALAPSAPGGLLGFGLGLFGTYAPVQNKDAWQRLTGEDVNAIGLVGLRADKGLPFGFDVGGFYSRVPGASASVYGAALSYAILEGSAVNPAIAVRGTYTGTSGMDDFNYRSYGTDISISKGFVFITPYAGAGYVWSRTKVDGRFGLSEEDIERPKFFVGARFSLLIVSLTAEYERLGGNDAYDLRAGFSF